MGSSLQIKTASNLSILSILIRSLSIQRLTFLPHSFINSERKFSCSRHKIRRHIESSGQETKMNVLDLNLGHLGSPLEAFAFDYVSLGIFALVNNFWPLVTVVTAAVSFWKFRAAAAADDDGISPVKKLVDDTPYSPLPPPNADLFQREKLSTAAEEEDPSVSCSSPGPEFAVAEGCEVINKGNKFVLYYDHDDEGEETTVAAAAEEKEWSKVSGRSGGARREEEWWGRWERVLIMRTGEMEWYRYQDLTVINGNVVRLWEECGGDRRTAQASCVVW